MTDHNVMTDDAAPIGVFDSGIGGLTVVAAIRRNLGAESIFYLGDTARVPYGGKSRATVERYSIEISGLLLAEHAKAIVVACNTASALALDRLRDLFRVPVLGVVEPGAKAAVDATRRGVIGVIGTRATIASGAYERAIHALNPAAEVISVACPLLVPLIEEGWAGDAVMGQVLQKYFAPFHAKKIDTLVLGCTHYPLAKESIAAAAGPEVRLVDSAENCARALVGLLEKEHLSRREVSHSGRLRVALTDKADGFFYSAARSLDLPVEEIELRSVQGITV